MSEPAPTEYPGVLDNRNWPVADRANELADGAQTVKIGVGYFYLGGFDLLRERLADANRVDLLIGTETDERTIEALEAGFSDDLDQFDKEEAADGITRLYQLIQQDKVRVRVYTDVFFHPKLYLFNDGERGENTEDNRSGHAIIGSSNLSAGGLSNNIELNVEKEDDETIAYLNRWFDELWAEAEEFDKGLMSERIRESQFGDVVTPSPSSDTISPYEATKRFIVEQFAEEVSEGTLLEDITGEFDEHEQLLAFQQDAVRAARRPLNKYGGVVLADSVGLGKSYIGAPLVQRHTTSLDTVLVIAPRRLKDMWMNDLLDADEGTFPTNATKEFISFSGLSRLSEADIQRLRNVDVLLIDEAHRLRNRGTQRYDKLQSIGRMNKKFIMLTATPIHNSVRDVDNLIKVFADDADFDLELGGVTPSEIFRAYDRLSSEADPTENTRRRLSSLEEHIESIMREVIIARDRRYVLENYDEITINGEPISVPERVPRLITPDDPRMEDLYNEMVDVVVGDEDAEGGGLNIPYVSADRYDADGDDEEELLVEYRSANILMLINLLKRLESSLAAFEVSIGRLIQREEITKRMALGELDDEEARQEAVKHIEQGFDEDFAKDINFEEVAEALERVAATKQEQIVDDIEDDLDDLKRLRNRAQQVLKRKEGSDNDAKANRLQTILEREVGDEKALIFSQYVPTIKSLFEQLTGENPDDTQVARIGDRTDAPLAAYVYGGEGFDSTIVKRFAPDAQGSNIRPEQEIDILFTTDVLGVGQNLQDSRIVINYDLHWNPMQMEQRIGRVDRITTRHDELLVYNFVPTGDLRDRLDIMQKLRGKIERIAKTVGHPAPILDTAEEQVHKTLITYEKLEEGGANFADEGLEGVGSKYDDLRNAVKVFCEEQDVTIAELAEAQERSRESGTQYFVVVGREGGIVILANLSYSDGYDEWQTTIFDEDRLTSVSFGGQERFTRFPRTETDVLRIFHTIASADTTRHYIGERNRDELRSFVEELSRPKIWEENILARNTDQGDTLGKIKRLCNSTVERKEGEMQEKAERILSLLNEYEISDWAAGQLRAIHRYRRRYNESGTIDRLHYKLTREIELAEPNQVIGVDVVLAGQPIRL